MWRPTGMDAAGNPYGQAPANPAGLPSQMGTNEPPTPDPYAAATSGYIDEFSPGAYGGGGSPQPSTYTPPSNNGGNDSFFNPADIQQWEQVIELSPDQQKLLDQQERLGHIIGNRALWAADSIQKDPFTIAGVGAPDQITGIDFSGMPELTAPNLNKNIGATSTGIQSGFGGAGDIMAMLDRSGLPGIPGIDDFGAERSRVEQALYDRQAAMLDPRYEQERTALETRLANQGIGIGTEAYTRAMADFDRNRNDAYSQARRDAILMGGNEQSRLFADALAGRGQMFGEEVTAGGFQNQAQQQQFNQLAERAGFSNAAQAQEFEQQMRRAGFSNDAILQELAAMSNIRSQGVSEQLANAGLNNQGRATAIQEALLERQNPMQELAMMLGGMMGPQAPQPQGQPSYQVAPPDLMGAGMNQYNAAMNQWQQDQNASNRMWGNIFSTGGTVLGAGLRPGGFLR
ncbi:MAG: hypothetical protein RIM84_07885 [Alphaproteobacteria bacterium]